MTTCYERLCFLELPINNVSIAVLTGVNTLLERHGVNPCDVVVAFTSHGTQSRLSFEIAPNSPRDQRQVEIILSRLGVAEGQSQLHGSDADIYRAIQKALRMTQSRQP